MNQDKKLRGGTITARLTISMILQTSNKSWIRENLFSTFHPTLTKLVNRTQDLSKSQVQRDLFRDFQSMIPRKIISKVVLPA